MADETKWTQLRSFVLDGTHVARAGVDTGFNSLIRPILYAAHHQIVNLSRLHSTNSSITAEIVGNICESGDGTRMRATRSLSPPHHRVPLTPVCVNAVFGHARAMPADTQEGDIVLIATAGKDPPNTHSHRTRSSY
jgi:diaminopimelate decarboxylase